MTHLNFDSMVVDLFGKCKLNCNMFELILDNYELQNEIFRYIPSKRVVMRGVSKKYAYSFAKFMNINFRKVLKNEIYFVSFAKTYYGYSIFNVPVQRSYNTGLIFASRVYEFKGINLLLDHTTYGCLRKLCLTGKDCIRIDLIPLVEELECESITQNNGVSKLKKLSVRSGVIEGTFLFLVELDVVNCEFMCCRFERLIDLMITYSYHYEKTINFDNIMFLKSDNLEIQILNMVVTASMRFPKVHCINFISCKIANGNMGRFRLCQLGLYNCNVFKLHPDDKVELTIIEIW